MQGHVQQQGADDPALRGALHRVGERALFHHTGPQPPPDLLAPREEADRVHQVLVADAIESRRQIRIENPRPAAALLGDYYEDRFDRVLAVPAGAEAVAPCLEPGFPFWFKSVLDPCLVDPVPDHRDAERSRPAVRLRDVHTLDGCGGEARRGDDLPRQPSSLRGIEGRYPVDPCRPLSGALLGYPPDTRQGVGPGPQHELLQVAYLLQVSFTSGPVDPLTESLYGLLLLAPVGAVPEFGVALGSVHRGDFTCDEHLRPLSVQLAPWCKSLRHHHYMAYQVHVCPLSRPAPAGIRRVMAGGREFP